MANENAQLASKKERPVFESMVHMLAHAAKE